MSKQTTKARQTELFDTKSKVYAVLDGASIPDLLKMLYTHEPNYVCLYRGELAPDLAECAPYLVQLEENTPFTDWLIKNSAEKPWGIFLHSKADMKKLRKHFRTFLMVESPEGKPLYFRYYDPRVLRMFIPTCTQEELDTIFGEVEVYFTGDIKPNELECFFSLSST